MFLELGVRFECDLTVYNDNASALKLAKNPVYHARTKHVAIRHHFIRDIINEGKIKLKHLCTDEMIADILTKGLNNFYNLKMAELVKPSAEYNRRAAIIESLCAGRTPVEIIKFFGYSRSTVYDVAKRYAASESFEKGSPSPARKVQVRQKSTRTPEIIQRVQDMIFEDPGTSLRKLASVLGVSETVVRRIAQEDFRYVSYILKVRQMVSEAAKRKTKFPASVHVLSVVSSEGDAMPPHFFQKGERVTKEVYLEVLKTVIKPWMETMASRRSHLFQQDGAPATRVILFKIGSLIMSTCFGRRISGLLTVPT
ncbi:LOW QUALITY PROTEIN: uncharacterized protein LOC143348207 [Colletes latitarsis]|uniref:LOW QUALITY PROTEIN: uncharacterized protein LOC143348207 n=1 Tax=Colletes latitarsis TaxID=2605962 RepID=UPI00403550CE